MEYIKKYMYTKK